MQSLAPKWEMPTLQWKDLKRPAVLCYNFDRGHHHTVQSILHRVNWSWTLTVEASPSSDEAGLVVGEEDVGSGDASRHDGVGEGDGGLQLDQGDVVTVEVARRASESAQTAASRGPCLCCVRLFALPDEQGAPVLVHNNVRGAHEHSLLLRLHKVVLSQRHPILPGAACWIEMTRCVSYTYIYRDINKPPMNHESCVCQMCFYCLVVQIFLPDTMSSSEDPLRRDQSASASMSPLTVVVVLQGNLQSSHNKRHD